MRPVRVTVSGVSASSWVPVDWMRKDPSLGVFVTLSATATYTVQITGDDVFNPAVTPTAFSVPNANLVAATTNQVAQVTVPCTAIRINVTASTGTVTLTVISESVT